MFETPFIERFSRIHPATPFLFYLPLLAWVESTSLRAGVSPSAAVGLGLAGAFLWTFLEYVLHRWIFHWTGPRPWQRRVHFIFHGVHHDHPDDGSRLVMPLGISAPAAIAFYALFRALFGAAAAGPLFVGLVLGYLTYDGLHYVVHHRRMRSRLGKWLKRNHMIHHHTGSSARWGVSSPLWDWVFGTMDDRPHRASAPKVSVRA